LTPRKQEKLKLAHTGRRLSYDRVSVLHTGGHWFEPSTAHHHKSLGNKGKRSEQKVIVEHVHIHEGGKAIVGHIENKPRGEGDDQGNKG